MFVVSALFKTVSTVLQADVLRILIWALAAYSILFSLLLLSGLAVAAIKKSLTTDFSYLILFRGFKKKGEREKSDPVGFLEKHTGLSVKSLWSIRYALQILPACLLGLALVLFFATCFYRVEPYQQAVVYRLGRLDGGSVVEPGLHLKLPWPVDKAEIYDVQRVKELSIGYEDSTSMDNLWTQSHAGEEYKLLLGDGNELVSVNMKISYVIDDLLAYVTKYASPERVLSAKAYELILHKTVQSNLDTILSVDRSGLSEELCGALNDFCKEAGFGLHVNVVELQSIHPPIDIADVYQGVVSASVQKQTLITNAEAKAAEKLSGAEQEADYAVLTAKKEQTQRVSDARYEIDGFLAAAEAYRAHPNAVRLSKFLDTFETAVAGKKLYVFIGDHNMSDYIVNSAHGTKLFSESELLTGTEEG